MLGLKIQSELNGTCHRLERQGVASFDRVPLHLAVEGRGKRTVKEVEMENDSFPLWVPGDP